MKPQLVQTVTTQGIVDGVAPGGGMVGLASPGGIRRNLPNIEAGDPGGGEGTLYGFGGGGGYGV